MRHKVSSDLRYPGLWRNRVFSAAPLLGPSGSTLLDNSGNRKHGTLTGMTLATDFALSGGVYAVRPNGSSSYVTHGDVSRAGNDGTNMTMMCWMRGTSAGNDLFSFARGNSLETQSVIAIVAHAGQARFFWRNSGGTSQDLRLAGPSINDGIWHCLIGTIDSVRNATLYLDGVLVTSGTVPAGTATTDTCLIGAIQRTSISLYSPYHVAEAAIWDRGLTPAEVSLISRRIGISYETFRRRSYKAASGGGGSTTASNLLLLGVG